MNDTSLGDYIASRRRALRLTQAEISERLMSYGVDRSASAIANWETGKQVIPIEILPALAGALEEKSVVKLYALAGVLANLPGADTASFLGALIGRTKSVVITADGTFSHQRARWSGYRILRSFPALT